MKSISYITHPLFLEHYAGAAHPERAERLTAIYNHIESLDISEYIRFITPNPATVDHINLVHDMNYIDEVKYAFNNGRRVLDIGDTVISEKSFDAALLAAGAVIEGIQIINEDNNQVVFCAVRPPGHHAEQGYARGFCLFNNVAIGARYAQKNKIADKVLIIDWDVHHGNGTQHTFERDNTVFYYSLHQFPFFPGTGAINEKGIDKGYGFTLNRPLPAYSGNDVYLESFKSDIKHIQNHFEPDLVIISAGFDGHKDDPLASQLLDEDAFKTFTLIIRELAEKFCNGKLISVLEGGYNLEALKKSVETHLRVLSE